MFSCFVGWMLYWRVLSRVLSPFGVQLSSAARLKEKVLEMETFRDLLQHQMDGLQQVFDQCLGSVSSYGETSGCSPEVGAARELGGRSDNDDDEDEDDDFDESRAMIKKSRNSSGRLHTGFDRCELHSHSTYLWSCAALRCYGQLLRYFVCVFMGGHYAIAIPVVCMSSGSVGKHNFQRARLCNVCTCSLYL